MSSIFIILLHSLSVDQNIWIPKMKLYFFFFYLHKVLPLPIFIHIQKTRSSINNFFGIKIWEKICAGFTIDCLYSVYLNWILSLKKCCSLFYILMTKCKMVGKWVKCSCKNDRGIYSIQDFAISQNL